MIHEEYRWWLEENPQGYSLEDRVQHLVHHIEKKHPIDSVYDSSLWAVAMAYLDYSRNSRNSRNNSFPSQQQHDFTLDRESHVYASRRGGVIGMMPLTSSYLSHNSCNSPRPTVCMLSLREVLEEWDPGFREFSSRFYHSQ